MTLCHHFQIVAHLDSLGFVQLLALHLKLLCGDELLDTAKKEKFGNEVSNVLFQITSCLRNMMNIRKSKDMFVHINGKKLSLLKVSIYVKKTLNAPQSKVMHFDRLHTGMDLLLEVVDNFLQDVDTICNVSRTLSVLSSEEDIDKVLST